MVLFYELSKEKDIKKNKNRTKEFFKKDMLPTLYELSYLCCALYCSSEEEDEKEFNYIKETVKHRLAVLGRTKKNEDV
jgi:hypothetical protein